MKHNNNVSVRVVCLFVLFLFLFFYFFQYNIVFTVKLILCTYLLVNPDLLLRIFGLEGRKEMFNDALNTFYLRIYGVRHMIKDHSDSKRGNPLPPHGLLFSINSNGSFICTIPQTG